MGGSGSVTTTPDVVAVDLKYRPVFQSHGRELSSPYTAAVDHEEMLFTMKP